MQGTSAADGSHLSPGSTYSPHSSTLGPYTLACTYSPLATYPILSSKRRNGESYRPGVEAVVYCATPASAWETMLIKLHGIARECHGRSRVECVAPSTKRPGRRGCHRQRPHSAKRSRGSPLPRSRMECTNASRSPNLAPPPAKEAPLLRERQAAASLS